MAKANLTLPNGTVVQIEGTADEVQRLLDLYSGAPPKTRSEHSAPAPIAAETPPSKDVSETQPDLVGLINLIRTCDDSERIESAVLDRSSMVNRVLLPLFIVHEHKGNSFGLTSGEISKITVELGVPITQPNVSTCLSGSAKTYVIGNKMRVKGQPVRYRLSRRGAQYFREMLGTASA